MASFDLVEWLKKARSLEERGRSIAYNSREIPCSYSIQHLRKWLLSIRETVGELEREIEPLRHTTRTIQELEQDTMLALCDFVLQIVIAANTLYRELDRGCQADSLAGMPVSKDIEKALRDLDKISERLIGSRCTWLLGLKEPYTVTAAINDITACFHRAIDVLSSTVSKKEGRCFIGKDASPLVEEVCSAWNDAVEEMHGLIEPEDLDSLKSWAHDDKVEFRVGSTPGHSAYIDIKEGRLAYYDEDIDVIKVMAALFEKIGLRCSVERATGAFCSGVTEENAKEAAKVLAAATSMDFRLHRPSSDYWPEEKIKECLEEVGYDRRKLEVCLVSKQLGL